MKSAANGLKDIVEKRNDEIAARASYVLAVYYYKEIINDYSAAKNYLLKCITYAQEGSSLLELARNEYDKLELYMERIKTLAISKSYDDHMRLAALYSAAYVRDYNYAFMIYDSLLKNLKLKKN